MISCKTAISLMSLLVVSSVSFQPALAQWPGHGEHGEHHGWGAPIPPDQGAQIKANFSVKIEQLRRQIRDGLSAGHLSAAEGAHLSGEVDLFASQVDSSYGTGGGFSHDEVTTLVNRSNALSSDITTAIASSWYHPTSTAGVPGAPEQINARITSLENAINAASREGKLSVEQAQELTENLRRAERSRDRAMRHGIDASEQAEINLALDGINSTFQTDVVSEQAVLAANPGVAWSGRPGHFGESTGSGSWGSGRFSTSTGISLGLSGNINDRIKTMRARIDEAARRGLISSSQSRQGQNDVNWVDRMQSHEERAQNGALSPDQQVLLTNSLDRINAQLTGWIDTNAKSGRWHH